MTAARAPHIERSLRFGSHLFVNPEDTTGDLFPRLAELAGAGFTLVRLFMTWNQLEPRPGVFRWTPFDEVFDEAGRLGMKVVPTLMAVSPPGWMGLTNGLQEIADLDDPAFMDAALAHAHRVVTRYREHPALDSWILWNEPGRRPRPDSPHVIRAYQAYLADEYGSVEAFNQSAYRPVASFGEILPPPSEQSGFVSHHGRIDWLRFCVANLQTHLGRLAATVHELDPDHPIHVNPHRVSQCLAEDGQSIWEESDLVDFMGCSAHPAWHSVRFPRDRYGDSIAMFADLARSATRDPAGHFWVTELQGGTTLMSAFESLHATPAESRQWLCQGVASGAKAVVYWCANARTDGYEAGEWDLLDLHGRPTAQLDAIADEIRRLTPHAERLSRARPPRADLAILVSEQSEVLDLADGNGESAANPRNRQKTADAVSGAYLLAADLSLEVRFMDLRRLAETPVGEMPPVLVLPGTVVLDTASLEKLEDIARSGRLVVGDGLCAWKTPHGRLAGSLWPAADRFWGAVCQHYGALPETAPIIITNREKLPAWFLRARLAPVADTRIQARWSDDHSPAVTWRPVGRGAACRVGTVLFQHYLTSASPVVRDWFRALISDRLDQDCPRLLTAPLGIRLRRLALDDTHIAFAINRTDQPVRATIRWPNNRDQAVEIPGHGTVVLDPLAHRSTVEENLPIACGQSSC